MEEKIIGLLVLGSDAASGWAEPTQNLGVHLTLLQPGGRIMPTTLLLAHPDLKTQRGISAWVVISASVAIETIGVV